MATLVSVPDFRLWAGTNVPANMPDVLIQDCLDEAEAGIVSETGAPLLDIAANELALAEMLGEEKRRASRLLARRNSPESVLGAGADGVVVVPVRDADSQRAVWHIRDHLQLDEGVA